MARKFKRHQLFDSLSLRGRDYEILELFNERATYYNVLAQLAERHELTSAKKLGKILGIKNSSYLLKGDLSRYSLNDLVVYSSKIICAYLPKRDQNDD